MVSRLSVVMEKLSPDLPQSSLSAQRKTVLCEKLNVLCGNDVSYCLKLISQHRLTCFEGHRIGFQDNRRHREGETTMIRSSLGSLCGVLAICILAQSPACAEVASPEEAFARASTLYAQEDYEGALRLYKQIIDGGWEAPELYYNASNCYLRTGRAGYALVMCKRAERLAPNDDVAAVAAALDPASGLMLVGHLPFMERLTSELVAGDPERRVFRFQGGGIVCIDSDDQGWHIRWTLMPEIG